MEEVVGDLNQGCYCAVFGPKARSEFFKEIIVVRLDLELKCNYSLKNFGDE